MRALGDKALFGRGESEGGIVSLEILDHLGSRRRLEQAGFPGFELEFLVTLPLRYKGWPGTGSRSRKNQEQQESQRAHLDEFAAAWALPRRLAAADFGYQPAPAGVLGKAQGVVVGIVFFLESDDLRIVG